MLYKIFKNYLIWFACFFRRRNRPDKKYKKRILLFKADKLGDFFIFIPHLQKLVSLGYKITLIAPSFSKDILKHSNIDLSFIDFNVETISQVRSVLASLGNTKFDFAINFSMNVWGGIFVSRSFAEQKIGLLQEREHYVYKGANLFYDKTYSYDEKMKTIDSYTKVITELVKNFEINYSIQINKNDDGYILIHPFARWKPREWPYFQKLIKLLIGKQIKVIGTEEEIIRWPDSDFYERIELKSIVHLMTLIDNCSAFIGNDSGPAHYAALIGKKTNVLWGPGNLDRIKPVGKDVHIFFKEITCRPCRQKGDSCEIGINKCLINLSVEDVYTNLKI